MENLYIYNDDNKKKKRSTDGRAVRNPYGLYSGQIDENGKSGNFDPEKTMRIMLQFMKNNMPPEADRPSNNYRPEWQHTSFDPLLPDPYLDYAKCGGKVRKKMNEGGRLTTPFNQKLDILKTARGPLNQEITQTNLLQQYQEKPLFHPEEEFNNNLNEANYNQQSNNASNMFSGKIDRKFGQPNRNNIALFSALDPVIRGISEKYDRSKQDQYFSENMYNTRLNTPLEEESDLVKHGYKLYRYGGKTKPKILKFEDGGELEDLEKELEDSLFEETILKNESIPVAKEDKNISNIEEDDDFMEEILYSRKAPKSKLYNYTPGESDDLSGYGDNFKNLDKNVVSATKELISLFPDLKLTSGRRNWGDKDAHPKGRAVDLSFNKKAFDYYKKVLVPKYNFNAALDPNHGTGKHIHLGYYKKGGIKK